MISRAQLGRLIDISAVKTNVSLDEIIEMVEYAKNNNLICVFGMPCYVPQIAELLKDRPDIHVGGVVGFPSGAEPTEVKVFQTNWCIENGATEIDMVMNVGFIKSKMYAEVLNDIKAVVVEAGDKPVKVILEVGYLTDEEIIKASQLVLESGAKFVKTGTGWTDVPTSLDHIHLINSVVSGKINVKAAGGVNSLSLLIQMYQHGVTRFGLGRSSIHNIFSELE